MQATYAQKNNCEFYKTFLPDINCTAKMRFANPYFDPDTVSLRRTGQSSLGIMGWAFADMSSRSSTSPFGLATTGQKEIVLVPSTGNAGVEGDGDAHSDFSRRASENYNGGEADPFSNSDDSDDDLEDHGYTAIVECRIAWEGPCVRSAKLRGLRCSPAR